MCICICNTYTHYILNWTPSYQEMSSFPELRPSDLMFSPLWSRNVIEALWASFRKHLLQGNRESWYRYWSRCKEELKQIVEQSGWGSTGLGSCFGLKHPLFLSLLLGTLCCQLQMSGAPTAERCFQRFPVPSKGHRNLGGVGGWEGGEDIHIF